MVTPIGSHKRYGEKSFEDDEEQLHPEGDSEDAVVSEVDPQSLILSTDEYSADHVAGNEEEEHAVMELGGGDMCRIC